MNRRFAELCGVIAICLIVGREPMPECTKLEKQKVVTYPNMGLLGLGPPYTALALIPVEEEQDVCVERKAPCKYGQSSSWKGGYNEHQRTTKK